MADAVNIVVVAVRILYFTISAVEATTTNPTTSMVIASFRCEFWILVQLFRRTGHGACDRSASKWWSVVPREHIMGFQ